MLSNYNKKYGMKRIIIAAALIISSAASLFAQNTSLTCKIAGVEDGGTIALAIIDGYNRDATYKATVTNGEAVLKFDLEGPRGFNLMVDGQFVGERLVLGKGENATLTATKGARGIENLSVQGSMNYLEYFIKRVDQSSLNKKYLAHQQVPVYVEYTKAYAAKDTVKCKQLRNSPEWKDFENAEKWFFNEVQRQYKGVQEANKDSWYGPFFMMTNYSYLTKDQLPEWEKFSDEAKNSYYGKICHDLIVPPSQAGNQMPDFSFTNFKTKKKTALKDVLKKSKYVLIDFWASWCKPCRAEIPNLKACYEKYHKAGFDIVSISADQREADWLKALDQEKLPWWNDRDGKQGICTLYKVQYYPTIYLLDADGKVVAKDIRGEELAKKLAELFAK